MGKNTLRAPATAALLLAAALVCAPAAANAAGWSPLIQPAPATSVYSGQVAMNARGDTVIAGGNGSGVNVSERPVGGAFEAPVAVGPGPAIQSEVAINAAGDVAAVWTNGSVGHVAVRPSGGTFSAPHDFLANQGIIDFIHVGMDDAGDTAVAWVNRSGSVSQVSTVVRSPDGTFGPVVSTAFASNTGYQTQLAMNGRGDAIVATMAYDGTNYIVQAATLGAGATSFSAFTPLSAAGHDATAPVVGIDSRGRSAVAWSRNDGSNDRVQVSFHPPGGVFSLPVDASPPGSNADYPAVAVSDSGAVLATWTTSSLATMRTTTFGTPFTGAISQLPNGGGRTSAALGADGSVAVSWAASSLYAATSPPGGTPVEAGPLAPSVSYVANVVWTPVAADAAGDAAIAFATRNTLGAVIYDATGPELRALSVPGSATAGAAASGFSVAPWDAFSAVGPAHWDFGDGTAGADGATATHTYATAGTYTVKVTATDTAGNESTATRTVTVAAAPGAPAGPPVVTRPPVAARTPVCKVPSLRNATLTQARARLRSAHCALGKVTTPRKLKKHRGLVVRGQSRRAGSSTRSGAKVDVTLGVKPRPRKHRKHKH